MIENREEIMTTAEVSAEYKISKVTLWQWEKDRKLLPAFRVGKHKRYSRSELEKFLALRSYSSV